MESMYDVRQLLKKFGIFIYTRNRIGDLQLMEDEIRDLYKADLIDKDEFQKAILILKRENSNV